MSLVAVVVLSVLVSAQFQGTFSQRQRPRPSFNLPYSERPLVFPSSEDSTSKKPMEVLYSWKQVDFLFPDPYMREQMIQNKQFIPINNLILDVDVYGEGRNRKVFVTMPRSRPGVPVTIATVSSVKGSNGNLLAPFPDWRSHTQGDCQNGITSVFRTQVDRCGRLWVLDSGNNNVFNGEGNSIVCNPQILVYDLRNNDRLIGKYRIPMTMIEDVSLLVTISVDTRSRDCNDAFAYIADSIAYKMIVFNLRNQQFWRIDSILFYPYPDKSRFEVNGVSFDLRGGIFGLALGPQYQNGRRLYFHCIDSVKQSWVETDVLRNQSVWQGNERANPRSFNLFGGSRSSQSAAAAINEKGMMFFGLIGSNEIACWDTQKRFDSSNIVSLMKDDTTLQFNSGIKVYGNTLYALTSRLQNFITRQMKPDEVNFRVMVGDVREMTKGTKCEVDIVANRVDYSPDSESVDFPDFGSDS